MIKMTIKEDDKDTAQEGGEDDDKIVENLMADLKQVKANTNLKPQIIDFEKDDDSNGHVHYISAVANLRARNYDIQEVDFFKVKHIAGKIIPAIATTTAMIVGCVGLEIVKYILEKPIDKVRNAFVNLALPLFVLSETMPPIKNKDVEMDPILFCPVKAVPADWTSWMT